MRFRGYSLSATILVLAVAALVLVAACGGGNEADSAERTSQEELLSWLPGGTIEFMFLDVETVSARPEFQDQVDPLFDRLTYATGEVINAELLRLAKIKNLAFSLRGEASDGEAAVVDGDFDQLLAALEQAGAGEPTETYRDAVIYRFEGSPLVYLSVANRNTLALANAAEKIKEIIDRVQDGGELSQEVLAALGDLGEGDFFYFVPQTPRNPEDPGNLFGSLTSRSWAASANDASTTVVRARFAFEKPEQAATIAAMLEEQEDVWSMISGAVDQDERVIMIEAIFPDEEVETTIFGD